MSKELEYFEELIKRTGIMNDTCAHLSKCLKTNKCHFNETNEDNYPMCPDYNMAVTIKKALEELEQLREFDRFCSMGKSIQYCKNEVVNNE